MSGTGNSMAEEWRRHWTLPIAAGLGYSTAVLYTYGMGPFFAPLEQAFGWTRVEASFGLFIAGIIGALLSIPVGLLVDRIGSRIVGLIGILAMTMTFGLLGTATGTKANWISLWILIAFANVFLQATVWTSAVATRFEKSRGFALAITLSGASLGSAVMPLLATWLIATQGWRHAFFAISGLWALVVFPIAFLFFRGAWDKGVKNAKGVASVAAKRIKADLAGVELAEGFRTSAFWRLLMASGLYTFTTLALVIHFVPVLTNYGAERMSAAGIASLVGIFAIAGRLATGLLLDRFAGHMVGAVVFLLPVVGCAMLWFHGAEPAFQMAAAACFGLTLGAEVDVIAYLATRYLGLKNFGALFGAMVGAMALGIALGPLAASKVYDAYHDYNYFLLLTMAAMAASSLFMATLGRARFGEDHAARRAAAKAAG